MSKLWSKGYSIDAVIENFTVGNDYILDYRLIPSDIAGSLAHAKMLNKTNLLSQKDFEAIFSGLIKILEEYENGNFRINKSDEDGHTAIENRLAEITGDAGKRIHLGRSRNDQVLTVMRIWMRHYIFYILEKGAETAGKLIGFAEKYKNIPMPGRTHMQPAMPSSVGLWAGGFAEQLLDDLYGIFSQYDFFDQCPLGSGAGYGTPLPLEREYTAELLGFSGIQNNSAYCGLSRGKFESRLLDMLDQISITFSKLAQDLILFSMPEFGWFSLPKELCTGSSIMPQKKNPDALELTRSRAASVGARALEVKNIIRSLPSGYNRDFQDTKGPVLEAADIVSSLMDVISLTVEKLQVNREKLVSSFDKGIFATDAAIDLVAKGASFRDAYREIGTNLDKLEDKDPFAAIADRTSSGTAGNLRLDYAEKRLKELVEKNIQRKTHVENALEKLAGRPIRIIV